MLSEPPLQLLQPTYYAAGPALAQDGRRVWIVVRETRDGPHRSRRLSVGECLTRAAALAECNRLRTEGAAP